MDTRSVDAPSDGPTGTTPFARMTKTEGLFLLLSWLANGDYLTAVILTDVLARRDLVSLQCMTQLKLQGVVIRVLFEEVCGANAVHFAQLLKAMTFFSEDILYFPIAALGGRKRNVYGYLAQQGVAWASSSGTQPAHASVQSRVRAGLLGLQ